MLSIKKPQPTPQEIGNDKESRVRYIRRECGLENFLLLPEHLRAIAALARLIPYRSPAVNPLAGIPQKDRAAAIELLSQLSALKSVEAEFAKHFYQRNN